MEFEKLIEEIKTVDSTDYQAIPFWSWNAKLEPEELVRQVQWMKQNGMGGFFMHARSGLKTEYLSEEWMHCIEVCAEEAERLGMNAWIYDENGWPSGFAGGKLLEDSENCDQYILTKIGEYDENATVSYLLNEEEIIRVQDEVIAGEYLNLYIRVANSTADILNPEVVQKFIDLTHEQYKERFGEDFQNKIKGFFTDEPQYQRWHTPYTKMIAAYFQEKFQEDILDGLGLLFVEKKGYRKFRYRYWKGMQELMLNNFAKKLYTWCDDNHIQLTGHYVEETTMGRQMMCCAGVMPFYEYEHIPGIDWLGNGSDGELSPRQVGSVASQLGKKQVLTETFGCTGWDITPRDLRRIAGFQYVNGVNLMCQHLVPYEEYGCRKRDYPAHFSAINPWVEEQFKEFNDYFSKIGYLLANGEEQVNVAILHPMRSAYFDYKRELEAQGFGIAELDEKLHQAQRILSGANVAYHFLDETLMAKYGFVEGAKIGCGKCSYDYLVLPKMLTMDVTTEKIISRYVENGGKVLLLDEKPCYLEGDEYHYDYLRNNCKLDEIIASQAYTVSNYNTGIYVTYRLYEGIPFMVLQNNSRAETYEQSFTFKDGTKSFVKWDPITEHTESIPLTVKLEAGETLVVFPSKKNCEEKFLEEVELRYNCAEVSFDENYLPVDFVRYSKDGMNYSKIVPCVALFQRLLEEHYEGEIYFKYEFDVRKIPSKIVLRAEECNPLEVYMNGVRLEQKFETNIEKHISEYNIAPFVKEGINEYVVKTYWHEDDSVYYALFGENVTESLKNSIVYDSELEAIYIAGTFGVYPTEKYSKVEHPRFAAADRFYIGEVPTIVGDPILEGFPFVRGAITLKQTIEFPTDKIMLNVTGTYLTAKVKVNGRDAGSLLFNQKIDVSNLAVEGPNEVEVCFVISNLNLLGPQHFVGEKEAGVTPWHFEQTGEWDDFSSPYHHDFYDIKKLYE